VLENTQFVTNLEPANARQFLPSLDEPCYKANFKLKVRVSNSKHTALSNGLISDVTEDTRGRWVEFEDSPFMSTYLLVLVIGRFEVSEL